MSLVHDCWREMELGRRAHRDARRLWELWEAKMPKSVLEKALHDTITEVKEGYRYNGVKMLADVQSGRAVHVLTSREHKLWVELHKLVHQVQS